MLALGFGGIWSEAGQQARSSLLEDYNELCDSITSSTGKTGKTRCSSSMNRARVRSLPRLDRSAAHA